MNVFLRELKANRKALIIWCVSILILVAGGMVKYAGFSGTGNEINQLMENLPDFMKAMWGLDAFNLTEIKGYYSVMFLYFVLMSTIHSSMLGATIISKEERDKTADFLLSKPTNRSKIVTSKLLAAITNVGIFNIVTLVTSIIFVGFYNKGESINKDIIVLMIAMFILQMLFLSVGLALGALSKKTKIATSGTTAVLLGTFILSMYIDMNDKVENLKYITPFKYFEAKELVFGNGFNVGFTILSLVLIGGLIAATYRFYTKRDINA